MTDDNANANADTHAELDDESVATISDYVDGTLDPAARAAVEAKLASDAAWKRTHDELVEARKFISGMRKARPSESFAQDVTDTIRKRSAGAFFGRRTLGDRLPFGVLVALALIALAVIAYVMWSSPTGSLEFDRGAPTRAPAGSGSILPTP